MDVRTYSGIKAEVQAHYSHLTVAILPQTEATARCEEQITSCYSVPKAKHKLKHKEGNRHFVTRGDKQQRRLVSATAESFIA